MVEQYSGRLRLKEVREVYSIVGECLAFGNDGVLWRRLLVQRLLATFGATIGSFADSTHTAETTAEATPVLPDSIIDEGWTNATERQHCWNDIRRHLAGNLLPNPPVPTTGLHIARQSETATPTGPVRAFMVAWQRVAPRHVQVLFLQRRTGEEAYSARHARLLRLLMVELRRHQPERLRSCRESALAELPKRQLQVLACLLIGHTAKETAEQLQVSVHTVQEHIRRLYERSGSTNRAELADYYRQIAPSLLAMPLEQMPDYRDFLGHTLRRMNKDE